MSENCKICKIIELKAAKIYEDEHVFAFLDPQPIAKGQITLVPKKHFPIIEIIPDEIISRLTDVANKISMILFQSLDIKGTNILINNGISAGQIQPHVSIKIIPRKENDGIDFSWEPKHLSEEDLSSIEIKYKDTMEGNTDQSTTQPEKTNNQNNQEKYIHQINENNQTQNPNKDKIGYMHTTKTKDNEPKTSKEEDYLIKQLRRIP